MGLLLDGGIAVVVIIVALALGYILFYNGLISKRNRVQDAWAQIDVQLKRRYDLIPNLVETVKGYMKYEQGTLTKITALRASIMSGSVQDKAQANNQITQALKTIFAVAENYPNLKSSDTYKTLQDELENTENKISYVRTSYNDYVLDFNNAIQQFPGNVIAQRMGFTKADFFQAPEEERAAIKVDLTSDSAQPPMAPTTPKPPAPPKAPKTPPKPSKPQ